MIPLEYLDYLNTSQIENLLIESARGLFSKSVKDYVDIETVGRGKKKIKKYSLKERRRDVPTKSVSSIKSEYKWSSISDIEFDYIFLNAIVTDPDTTISKEYVKGHLIHSKSPLQMWNEALITFDKGSKLNLAEEITSFSGSIYNYNHNYSDTERLEINFSEPFRFSDYCKKKKLFSEMISGTAHFKLGYADFRAKGIIFQSYKDEQGSKKFRFVFSFGEYERKQFIKNLFLQEVMEFENGLLV